MPTTPTERLLAPDPPYCLQVELTSRCNLRCRMCPLTTGSSSTAASPGPMRDAVFDEVLAAARRCRQVVIAGYGEPLADRRCLPLLAALNREEIKVRLSTNGIGITTDVARFLAGLEHLIQINVSVDSPDAEVYRQMRQGNLGRVLAGLRILMEEIDTPDRVTVSCVATRSSLPTLPALPAILAARGVRRLVLQGLLDYNADAPMETLLGHGELSEAIGELRDACRGAGVELEVTTEERTAADLADPAAADDRFYRSGQWDPDRTRQCLVPWEHPFVDKDGGVFPCCFAAATGTDPLGRLTEATFDEVWTGDAFRRFRAGLLDGATTPAVCRACTVVPLGPHPLRRWAAALNHDAITVSAGSSTTVTVRVRNDGTDTWTSVDLVRVGTASPRDWGSPLAHPEWLSDNRAATFREASVEPGGLATFTFPVTVPSGTTRTGQFQLVADGVCWLPNTQFSVTVTAPGRPSVRRLVGRIARSAVHR